MLTSPDDQVARALVRTPGTESSLNGPFGVGWLDQEYRGRWKTSRRIIILLEEDCGTGVMPRVAVEAFCQRYERFGEEGKH